MWNADFVCHSIRTRARTRRRPRRCFSAFDFEDEDDDKDDDNTLHKANFNPRLDYGFFVLKCCFIKGPTCIRKFHTRGSGFIINSIYLDNNDA